VIPAPAPYDLYALRRPLRRPSWRNRIVAVVVAALIQLGFAALFLLGRQTAPIPTDQAPVITVTLVPPPMAILPPLNPRRAVAVGHRASGHGKPPAPAAPVERPVRAPPSPFVAQIAPVLERAPAVDALPPLASLSALGATGDSVGGDGSGSGDGAGLGIGGSGGRKSHHVRSPLWVHYPTPGELARYYPPAARDAGVNGEVLLACVLTDTRAHDCQVLSERPLGQGFGAAAVAMSSVFRLHPPLLDGKPLDNAPVKIPLYFGTPAPVTVPGGGSGG